MDTSGDAITGGQSFCNYCVVFSKQEVLTDQYVQSKVF